MSEQKSLEIRDEIDLKDLFLTLWKGRYIIFSISLLAMVFSSTYVRNSERKYSVEVVLKSVSEADNGPVLSGFSGLASLAGISLPTGSSSDFITYQKLIFSEEVAERVFTNRELMIKLFRSEWDLDSKSFKAPKSGQFTDFKNLIKSALIGVGETQYIPPNPKRLSLLLRGTLAVTLDKNTGFISIFTEVPQPDTIVELITIVSQETDNLLKERFISTAEETLGFYYKKLLTSRVSEHREALAKLISVQDQKLMLASKSTNFVAEPLTRPNVSLHPTSPKANLIWALGLVLGFFVGSAIVIVKGAFKASRSS